MYVDAKHCLENEESETKGQNWLIQKVNSQCTYMTYGIYMWHNTKYPLSALCIQWFNHILVLFKFLVFVHTYL